MKKLLLCFPVTVVVLLTATSCNKKQCYECTTSNFAASMTQVYCDLTREEADQLEKAGTNVTSSQYTGTIKTTTKCIVKN